MLIRLDDVVIQWTRDANDRIMAVQSYAYQPRGIASCHWHIARAMCMSIIQLAMLNLSVAIRMLVQAYTHAAKEEETPYSSTKEMLILRGRGSWIMIFRPFM